MSILDQMERAVEKVRRRLEKAASVLEAAGIPYAVSGGNAVAAWVATVDDAAVRNTQDVDLLIDRAYFAAACVAMEHAGFVYRHAAGIDMFLDGPDAKARDAVHIIFAGEKVRPDYPVAAPTLSESNRLSGRVSVVSLEALVRMKLTSFRLKDQVHLIDMLDVGLIDESWAAKLPEPLAGRLRDVIEKQKREM